ncbi:hypothetical protein MIB92_00925 [Aestuariirhabdus sp. Z084]|uniref:hypothetical protein n=1 Tax=Aestuariirhabdus haliotis TaxID=2918751 RepID=UPI0020BFB33E|nr:hypothetical protein [Aestuariirhabdus haliotis]MCL6414200.1 hypothetical protein [Aestuariirhabdus haliotis]
MIRLSKQLVLLQNQKELNQAGINPTRSEELIAEYGGDGNIDWAFDRAFWDETAGKLTLLYQDTKDPANEERCLTLRLERTGKKAYRVTNAHRAQT